MLLMPYAAGGPDDRRSGVVTSTTKMVSMLHTEISTWPFLNSGNFDAILLPSTLTLLV